MSHTSLAKELLVENGLAKLKAVFKEVKVDGQCLQGRSDWVNSFSFQLVNP